MLIVCLLTYLLKRPFDIILKDEKKIETKSPWNFMKGLIYLCTKHANFTYTGKIDIQIYGVPMESPLDSLLANTFMISLESAILPPLRNS